MLSMLRSLFGIVPESTMDQLDFASSGWRDVAVNTYIVFCIFGEAILRGRMPTEKVRQELLSEGSDRFFVLKDGTWREFIDYVLTPAGVKHRWDCSQAYPPGTKALQFAPVRVRSRP